MRNLITDVGGLRVGNAHSAEINSGATVLVCDEPVIASGTVLGGAPGTRGVSMLEPDNTVETVDAIALSGGSAFGLATATGVEDRMRSMGRGFQIGDAHVPIVPGAIVFDLLNGGDKNWGDENPYPTMGREACEAASADFQIGRNGGGYGATTATGHGGLGSASAQHDGFTVGALVVVNAVGTAYVGDSSTFWAAPFERDGEFGARGFDLSSFDPERIVMKGANPAENTTIGVIATDLALTKAQCKRLAIMACIGYGKALWPSHAIFDGDMVFGVSTGKAREATASDMTALSALAPATMARAIARGIFHAEGTW
ncbi:MAG: P1 family peptidase [Pseudomonadota bacterium]